MDYIGISLWTALAAASVFTALVVRRDYRFLEQKSKLIWYEDFIERNSDCRAGVDLLKAFLSFLKDVDDFFRNCGYKDLEFTESIAKSRIAEFEYNELCMEINALYDDPLAGRKDFLLLLDRCAKADQAVIETYGEELPEGFVSLKDFVISQINDDGDIPVEAFA